MCLGRKLPARAAMGCSFDHRLQWSVPLPLTDGTQHRPAPDASSHDPVAGPADPAALYQCFPSSKQPQLELQFFDGQGGETLQPGSDAVELFYVVPCYRIRGRSPVWRGLGSGVAIRALAGSWQLQPGPPSCLGSQLRLGTSGWAWPTLGAHGTGFPVVGRLGLPLRAGLRLRTSRGGSNLVRSWFLVKWRPGWSMDN
jgi:hypothetical protein